MNLKEFISNTLTQICEGVVDAQRKTSETKAEIAPMMQLYEEKYFVKSTYQHRRDFVHMVSFDVAVTVENSNSKQDASLKGTELQVAAFKISINGDTGNSKNCSTNETVSRIKFEIPIFFPQFERQS